MPVKQEQACSQQDLLGISDLLEFQLPNYDLNTSDLLTFDGLGVMDSMEQSSQGQPFQPEFTFENPFESSISDWGTMAMGLEDLL